MPTIAIYLPNDLYEKVKKNTSKTIQKALREHFGMDEKESLKMKTKKGIE